VSTLDIHPGAYTIIILQLEWILCCNKLDTYTLDLHFQAGTESAWVEPPIGFSTTNLQILDKGTSDKYFGLLHFEKIMAFKSFIA